MAMSTNPAGYIEEAVIDNHVQLAAERGIALESWADQVEPESPHLAAALRERAAVASKRSDSAPDKPVARKAPSSEKGA